MTTGFAVLATVGPKPGVVEGEVVVPAGSTGIATLVGVGALAVDGIGSGLVAAAAPALAVAVGWCERPDQTAMPIAMKATMTPIPRTLRLAGVAEDFEVSG